MDDGEIVICIIMKLPYYLTYEKQYEVVEKQGKYLLIKNNTNQLRRYKSEYFVSISTYRDMMIDKVLIDE